MAGIKAKDTKPEVVLRKALHALGFRYRLGGGGLKGKPDLVFPSRRAVVFVHGCFWHKHDCKYFKWPRTNSAFWVSKLEANAKRDEATKNYLMELGWQVITVWECELRSTNYTMPNRAVQRVSARLNQAKDSA